MKLFIFFLFNFSSLLMASPKLDDYIFTDQKFELMAPESLDEKMAKDLWATNYYLPQIENDSGDIPLRDHEGFELGPRLSLNDWCKSSLEGSVVIKSADGSKTLYNYHVSNELSPVDCSSLFSHDVSKTKFKISKTRFGEGILNYQLVPFRSIATDQLIIPAGTILYIPEAKGKIIPLPSGDKLIHDGYFFAVDRGGAIKDNHIDVFTGILKFTKYFNWISHDPLITFKAYIITDPEVTEFLRKIHKKPL